MPFLLFPTAASAVQMCIVVLQTPAACLKDKGKASEVNWPDCGDWVSRNSPIMENVRHVLRFPLFSQMSLPLLTSVGIPIPLLSCHHSVGPNGRFQWAIRQV